MKQKQAISYWLLKTEPSSFSIADLERKKRERWDGVRNYQARNNMRAMKKGDIVFIHHSSIKEPAIVGVGKIVETAYPDPSQFDPKSQYFDETSSAHTPRWSAVDVQYVRTLEYPYTLSYIKHHPTLRHMQVALRGSRLSVMTVSARHAKLILEKVP